MSWTKPGQGGASPGPPQYGAPQPQPQYGNQQNVYTNYGSGVGNVPQQQYWQMGPPQQTPQVQYEQHVQYGQVLQELPPNTNQFYQQPAAPASAAPLFNQNYSNQGYMNPQQNAQHNYYQNQTHQDMAQNAPRKDMWEDNWDWGWEDTAKQAQKAHQNMNRQAVQPEQAFNNANVIDESFATNESWNWSMDDKKDNKPTPSQLENSQTEVTAPQPTATAVQTVSSEVVADAIPPPNLNGTRHHVDEVRTLSDRDVIKERMPNLAAGRRLQLENLTPQWSIESQMSQESSDGPHTHSEGTYRSENQSRNSNSPAPAGDYSQASLDDGYPPNDEWSRHSDEPTLAESDRGSRRESRDDLTNSLHDMSLGNYDNFTISAPAPAFAPAPATGRRDSRTQPDNVPPSPAASPATAAVTPPLRPPAAAPVPVAGPPPTFPPTSSHNPFKNAGSFSHKSRTLPVAPGAALTSPAVVGLAAASRAPVGFEANLETTPDNSERPDRPLVSPYRAVPAVSAPITPVAPPDNLEVAPRSDRNEYMQTAHLSSGPGDYGENAEYAPPPAPPPGLRRLVVGVGDEPSVPPPGLARMVPGRNTEPGERRYRQAEGRPRPPGEAGPEPRLPPPTLERGSPGDGAAPPPPPTAAHAERERRDNVTEGENLQDPEPAAAEPVPTASQPARSATPDPPGRDSTPQDSDRDRSFDERPEPRRDRDRDRDRPRRGSRDRDDEGRYSRTDRKYERDERRGATRDRAADGPDSRRTRRSARHRYETEDTDYYSDRDRDRRSHREGSYAGKPPRGDSRRHHAAERRYEEDRPRGDRDRDRYERRYRDIDPSRKYGNLRRDRDRDQHDRPRREKLESPSREATATDEDTATWERRDRTRDRDRRRRDRDRDRARVDPYYDAVSQRQYEYYERLRAADPAAYMALYKQLMGAPYAAAGLAQYGAVYDDRGSVHSGRSSTTGLKGNDTYYGNRGEAGSLRDAPSLRTDVSDRELNTDASLNLQLDESTVRSERMTPFRYSTAHVKGSISSRDVVVVVPSYPVDGAAATVRVVRVGGGARLPALGPLRAPRAHKRSALEYCAARAAAARAPSGPGEGAPDPSGYALVWDLLATMLRQNGVVVGTDLAELLMKNVREFEWRQPSGKSSHNESRRESSVSGSADDADHDNLTSYGNTARTESRVEEASAIEKYKEYLIYGNRQEALEWAMSAGLWGHAWALAASGSGRDRAAAAARFLASLPPSDTLHTLYTALAGAPPPALAMMEERCDWRPHAAVLLANRTSRPENDVKTLIQLGDVLSSRGAVYSAQFVWVCAGAGWAPHPLAPHPPRPAPGAPAAAPARLSLLLADPRAATFGALLTPHAVLATEVYEYARSLASGSGSGSDGGYTLPELQVYRLGTALALADAGQYERALAYTEAAARAVLSDPQRYPPAFLRALAELADRLKYHEPALASGLASDLDLEGDSAHRWIHEIQALAVPHAQVSSAPAQQVLQQYVEHSTPVHQQLQHQEQYSWDQSQHFHHHHQQQADINQSYADPTPPPQPAEYANYAPPPEEQQQQQQYYSNPWPPAPGPAPAPPEPPAPAPPEPPGYDYGWHQEQYTYGEGGGPPTITMPGAVSAGNAGNAGSADTRARNAYGDHDDDRPYGNNDENEENESNESGKGGKASSKKRAEKGEGGGGGKAGGAGWLGGLFTKLSLRPPNQMILPDDKNPTIVWDEQHKRWRNTDGAGEDEPDQPPPPPPTNKDLAPIINRQTGSPPLQSTPGAPPSAPPVSNIFKMQKGRHIKKSYVDVFNPPGAGGTAPRPPAAEVLGPAPPALGATPPHNYFVPAAAPAQQQQQQQQQQQHVQVEESLQLEVRMATPSPRPTPSSTPVPDPGGIYDPNQMEDDLDQYRSGI